ncbi:ABC transporter ATP-binding protein [Intestinimonas massiliensis]|jgi:multiple sugar transport system ATP-binding protein|uniref:ABC transporter ATP-binding protein n=1 Tax=Intestinimonas massiliensis (ex Afouda et al. 2020) TaxID=1673721 RepID=A0ABS9MCD4_9FIRM|nr:ABC transporter ATP-binding protein [Intestinimonas massiliensis (ex Afouda et al. 2020)]MCG4528126.1 ABC transporter ATP-binding protein [Intestinimonas massiliensis (ex Afouda et al. 2020)]MCQ4806817.1 ABC transporter ATP-binding protein [Intestinimonas massiliensis (ex Afouda et al. 2020)]
MPEIILTHVTKRWDKFYAVDDLNLVIDDNAFVTLLGPSGCGKTTTLRMIAGLETPTSGRITIGDKVVFDSDAGINIPPNKRKVGFLFQNYALWPNMTVYQNIAFGLGNIKEELPKFDLEARRTAALIRILQRPDDVVRTIRECVDKKGRLDVNKAHIKLIDRYEISLHTAKTLMGYKLHESMEPVTVAKARLEQLERALESARAACAAQGCTFREDFAYLKDGVPVTGVRKLSPEEIDLSVRRVARIVKIGMFMDRYPSELSGGQQQRVAIARTLAPEPAVLFMDEPLSNLDAKLRLEMRSELQRLHIDTGSTFIYVTHDQMEAMTLATKICLIDNGVLQQYDAPLDVYNKPNNLFVADFVGNPAINFMEAKGRQAPDGTVELEVFAGTRLAFTPRTPLDLPDWFARADAQDAEKKAAEQAKQSQKGHVEKGNKDTPFRCHIAKVNETEDFGDEAVLSDEDFVLGVRPEFLSISEHGALEAEVYSAMPTGMETTVKLRIGEYLLTGVIFGGVLYQIGQKVRVDFEGDHMVLFSRKNGRIITQGSLSVRSAR